jgi:hypothetical protein
MTVCPSVVFDLARSHTSMLCDWNDESVGSVKVLMDASNEKSSHFHQLLAQMLENSLQHLTRHNDLRWSEYNDAGNRERYPA